MSAMMSTLPPGRTLIDGEKSASCRYQRSAANELRNPRSNDVEYGLLKFFHLVVPGTLLLLASGTWLARARE
jgi:hypothetical protein